MRYQTKSKIKVKTPEGDGIALRIFIIGHKHSCIEVLMDAANELKVFSMDDIRMSRSTLSKLNIPFAKMEENY